MLFYQIGLLLGYLYAHWTASKQTPLQQFRIHATLLIASGILLAITTMFWNQPILPGPKWKPDGSSAPAPAILKLLAVSIGFPFLLLSSTSPLVQKWTSLVRTNPYRLYALSNLGSLLALITYPFVVEPAFSLQTQSGIWTAGYALFLVLSFLCASRMRNFQPAQIRREAIQNVLQAKRPYSLWIGLSACGSLLLLATTNQLCRDIAVIPFLWVLPLTLYLLTFILCFDTPGSYSRLIFHITLIPLIVLAYVVLSGGVDISILHQILVFSAVLFCACMICHGELYRSRPDEEHLTSFYLCIAAGGALGGLFSGVIAPYVMKGFWELHLGLWLTAFLTAAALLQDRTSWIHRGPALLRILQIMAVLVALAFLLLHHVQEDLRGAVQTRRNFYGVLTVLKEEQGTKGENYSLRHGRIRHGYQFTNPERRKTPTSYYGVNSGVALAIESLRNLKRPLRIGVVGLGVGTIAAYGQKGDEFYFYEIDRDVADLASGPEYFHFLNESAAEVQVILGDGRIAMEREAVGSSPELDLLAIDAFSSDSIPAHLLTAEAVEVYLKHLKRPYGVLAFHISNRFLDLEPVIFGLADHFKLHAAIRDARADRDVELASTWMLLMFEMPDKLQLPKPEEKILWTDDYHSIFPILKWTND